MPAKAREAAIDAPRPKKKPKQAATVENEGIPAPSGGIVDELNERIVEMGQELERLADDNASMSRVLESEDRVKGAIAEAARYRELNRVLTERLNGQAGTLARMTKEAKRWKGIADRLEKEAKKRK